MVCIQEKPDGLYPRTRPDDLMVFIQEETRWIVSRKKPDGLYPGRKTDGLYPGCMLHRFYPRKRLDGLYLDCILFMLNQN